MTKPRPSILSIRPEYLDVAKFALDEAGVSYSMDDNDRVQGAKNFYIPADDERLLAGVLRAIPREAHVYRYVGQK